MLRFDGQLRSRLRANLTAHPRRAIRAGERRAAVAIVLVASHAERDDHEPLSAADIDMSAVPGELSSPAGGILDGRMVGVAGGAAFLLCRRAAKLNRHAGQWALPGGRIDGEETPLQAALRELEEELGLRLGPDSVVGWLDDYETRSGYVITPVVLWAGAEPTLRPAPDEVLGVYRVGLHALRDSAPRLVRIEQSDRPVLQVPLGNDLIHAPTGALLYQFREVALAGKLGDRVDQFEEPVFAWH